LVQTFHTHHNFAQIGRYENLTDGEFSAIAFVHSISTRVTLQIGICGRQWSALVSDCVESHSSSLRPVVHRGLGDDAEVAPNTQESCGNRLDFVREMILL
jgi:hypothetical protein